MADGLWPSCLTTFLALKRKTVERRSTPRKGNQFPLTPFLAADQPTLNHNLLPPNYPKPTRVGVSSAFSEGKRALRAQGRNSVTWAKPNVNVTLREAQCQPS